MRSENSYGQILKSSSIMGGAAGFVMLFGLIRTKFAAVLIGTTGVGLLASFTAIQTLLSTLSGFGLGGSAVREIAAAVGKKDPIAISRCVYCLRRLSWFTGLSGMCLLILLSPIISQLTFDSNKYAPEIAALGLVVLMSNLSTAQLAMLQGMRRVSDMARANVFGAAAATMLALVFYCLVGLRGIVPSLVVASFIHFAFARHFARQINFAPAKQTLRQTLTQGRSMIGLGFSLMWSNFLFSAVGYTTIYLINRFEGIQATGLYSAAFLLSGALVSFVLSAMSADYYPRLTAMSVDKAAMRRLVNEQTEIGLLLAIPGLLAGIFFAPWLVKSLYSNEFILAAPLLQWFILGCLGRVISFPMGFVILAMGKVRWYLFTETTFNALHVVMIAIFLSLFGIEGVAIAYCVLYMGYTFAMYLVNKHLIGFRWDEVCAKLLITSVALLLSALIIARTLNMTATVALGGPLVIFSGIVCLRSLISRVGVENRAVQVLRRIPGFKLIAGI